MVNVALPTVLFTSFLHVELEPTYFWFLPLILGYCVTLFFISKLLHKSLHIQGEYFPFLMTGYEYGMMGVSLFGAAYGLDQIGKIAIIDLGQETFIWFIYIALLMVQRDGATKPGKLLKMFATSPVILAILTGLLLNFTGLRDILPDLPLVGGLLSAVDLLGNLTIPLILMVVGYGINIDIREIFSSSRVIFLLLMINIPVALILNHFFVRGLMSLDKGFEAALFTLLILPAPFILTLFMKQYLKEELHKVDNTLTLHILMTILVFIIYFAFIPSI